VHVYLNVCEADTVSTMHVLLCVMWNMLVQSRMHVHRGVCVCVCVCVKAIAFHAHMQGTQNDLVNLGLIVGTEALSFFMFVLDL